MMRLKAWLNQKTLLKIYSPWKHNKKEHLIIKLVIIILSSYSADFIAMSKSALQFQKKNNTNNNTNIQIKTNKNMNS